MAEKYLIGLDCKIYYDALGVGAGTWAELKLAKTPKLDMQRDEAPVEDRASEFKRYLAGLIDAPLEIEMNRKVGSAAYLALRTAFLTRNKPIGIAFCSDDITVAGTEVFAANFIVTKFPLEAPISDTVTMTVTLKLFANSDEDGEADLYDVAA